MTKLKFFTALGDSGLCFLAACVSVPAPAQPEPGTRTTLPTASSHKLAAKPTARAGQANGCASARPRCRRFLSAPQNSAGMIQPQQVSIDTQGLPYSWQANLVPATPYDASQPPGPKGLPQHIEINFGVTDPSKMQQPGDPVMYIIPVDAYRQMWDQAGNPSVTNTISKVYTWTIALQSPPPTSGLPALPPEKISGFNDLAVQIGRAKSDLESASRSGYRFVGRWAQDANPVTAETRLWYTYQGFTNDSKYLVSFFYPVTTAKLPKQAEMSAAEMQKFNSDPQAYIKAQAEMLNKLPTSDWQPDLASSTRWSARCASRGCRNPACTMWSGNGPAPPIRASRIRSPIRRCMRSYTVRTARCASRPTATTPAARTPTTAAWWAVCG